MLSPAPVADLQRRLALAAALLLSGRTASWSICDQRRRVAVDDREDLDLGLGRRQAVELLDQGRHQLHADWRADDDQRVAAACRP